MIKYIGNASFCENINIKINISIKVNNYKYKSKYSNVIVRRIK